MHHNSNDGGCVDPGKTDRHQPPPEGKVIGRFGVGHKAALLFLVLILLAVANVALVRNLFSESSGVGNTINVAGKLRMLSQKTAFLAVTASLEGGEDHRPILAGMHDFEQALTVLSEGGVVFGLTVDPLPGQFASHLRVIEVHWQRFRDGLAPIVSSVQADGSALSPLPLGSWHAGTVVDVADLLQACEALISAILSSTEQQRQALLWQMYLMLVFGGLVLLGAFIWTRRHVVAPLHALSSSCHRLASGDYKARVAYVSSDEIGTLSQAFNASAERIGGLVERLESEHASLARAQAMFAGLAQNPIAGVYIVQSGHFQFVNARMAQMLGYPNADALLHASVYDSVLERDRPLVEENIRRRIAGEVDQVRYERKALRKDGSTFDVEVFGTIMTLDGSPATMGIILDISKRKQAEMAQRLAHLAYQNSSEAMVITDPNAFVRDVNPAFTAITGWRREDVLTRKLSMLSSGRHDKAFYEAMWGALKSAGKWQGEIWNRRKNGEEYVQRLVVDTSYNSDGSIHSHIGVFSDITRRKASEASLWRQANYDELTGLPNRYMFQHQLINDMGRAQRKAQPMGLLFLDLDLFKEVNDTFGHEAGDELLRQVAQRLTHCVRETDMVARLGGDEFTIILSELGNRAIVERICKSIHVALTEPFQVDDTHAVQVSASIGVAFYPMDGTDPDELLRHADMAMYRAKEKGPNQFAFYEAVPV